MEEAFYQLFEQYGIYAVFLLCTVEGDITFWRTTEISVRIVF
jgi:hypothetical protein